MGEPPIVTPRSYQRGPIKASTTFVAATSSGPSAGAIGMMLVLRDFDRLTTYFVVVQWAALLVAVAAVFVCGARCPMRRVRFGRRDTPWVPIRFVPGTGDRRDGNCVGGGT